MVWFDTPGNMEKKYVADWSMWCASSTQCYDFLVGAGHGLGDYNLAIMNIPLRNIGVYGKRLRCYRKTLGDMPGYDIIGRRPKRIFEEYNLYTGPGGHLIMLDVGPPPVAVFRRGAGIVKSFGRVGSVVSSGNL